MATEGVGEGAAEVTLAEVVSRAVEAAGSERGRLQLALEDAEGDTAISLGMSAAKMPCHVARHRLAPAQRAVDAAVIQGIGALRRGACLPPRAR